MLEVQVYLFVYNNCYVIIVINEEQLYHTFCFLPTHFYKAYNTEGYFNYIGKPLGAIKNAYNEQKSTVQAEKCLASINVNTVLNGPR